jgi:xanthosine utilization system XapX-like protein
VRKLLIAVVAALAGGVVAAQFPAVSAAEPSPPPVATVVACSGVELVSETVQSVECSTDAVAGAISWNPDHPVVKLKAKPEHDSPPVAAAAGWSSNGPIPVSGNEFCVALKADPHPGPAGYAVVDLVLSWDGLQQPTVTLPLERGNASYCVENVPQDAQNFFWEALAVTGASQGDAKVKVQFAGVSFAAGL